MRYRHPDKPPAARLRPSDRIIVHGRPDGTTFAPGLDDERPRPPDDWMVTEGRYWVARLEALSRLLAAARKMLGRL